MAQERQFNQGEKPVIAVFNNATVPLGPYSLDELIDAMQVYIDDHIVPRWATPATLQKSTGYIKGAWALVFLDNADVAGRSPTTISRLTDCPCRKCL